jgi:diguanylate cyclase (GGDEF)-like protein/PAS domain S-box-containing protein
LLFIPLFFFLNEKIRGYIIIPALIAIFFISYLVNRRLQREIEERKAAAKALQHSEQLFREIFNNAAAGIALCNREGYYKLVNSTLCRMLGYTEAELRTMKFDDITYPDDLEKSTEFCQDVWQGLYPWRSWEKRYICKNKDIIWTEINMSPIRGEDQEVTDVIAVLFDITDRKKMEEELKHQAATDFLTGIDNRLAFLEKGQETFARSQRYRHGFSLLLLDVDRFKFVNDVYGHLVGDRVLRDVVWACRSALRETDIFARIGGEEFAVILIEAQRDMAYQVALRIQQRVKEVVVEAGNKEVQVTVSIGIGMFREQDRDLEEIFKRADDALYQAKNSGRNKIVFEDSGN